MMDTRTFSLRADLPRSGVKEMRGLFYLEPKRTRSILVWKGPRGRGAHKPPVVCESVETPPLVIGTLSFGDAEDAISWCVPSVYILREPFVEPFDIEKTPMVVWSSGMCIGGFATTALAQGRITAPEAVWMTVWNGSVASMMRISRGVGYDYDSIYPTPNYINTTLEGFLQDEYGATGMEWKEEKR